MAPILTLDIAADAAAGIALAEGGVISTASPEDYDEFTLDMRVIESVTPLVTMMCDTSDTCGSTCENSACITSSNDPLG